MFQRMCPPVCALHITFQNSRPQLLGMDSRLCSGYTGWKRSISHKYKVGVSSADASPNHTEIFETGLNTLLIHV